MLFADQLEALDDLAQQFEESVDRMPAWGTGGQLYTHYIELKGLMVRVGKGYGKKWRSIIAMLGEAESIQIMRSI